MPLLAAAVAPGLLSPLEGLCARPERIEPRQPASRASGALPPWRRPPLLRSPLPPAQAGSIAGIAGLTFASFTAVSFLEVRRKIEDQLAAGEEPYQLRVEPRKQPPRKPGAAAKKKAGSGKRKK